MWAKCSEWVSGCLSHCEALLFQRLYPRSCLLANTRWTPASLLPMGSLKVLLGNQEGPLPPITGDIECQRHSNVDPHFTVVFLFPCICLWTFIPEATAWLPWLLGTEDSGISSSRKKLGQIRSKRSLDNTGTLRGPLCLQAWKRPVAIWHTD